MDLQYDGSADLSLACPDVGLFTIALQIVLASMDSQFDVDGNTLGALRTASSWFVDKYLITSATSECDLRPV